MTAESAGAQQLIAESTAIGVRETFRSLVHHTHGTVSLKPLSGKDRVTERKTPARTR